MPLARKCQTVMCWAYLRRYFVEALQKYIESAEAILPVIGTDSCNKLFKEERLIKKLSPEERKRKRLEKEKPSIFLVLFLNKNLVNPSKIHKKSLAFPHKKASDLL